MNLRLLANMVTQITNPNVSVNWLQSTGYTTDSAGKRTPTYSTTAVEANVQAVDAKELAHMDAMNVQGVMRSVYLYGNLLGVDRVEVKGGDLLQFAEIPGGTDRNWLIVRVAETWPEWCHVIVTLQTDSVA